MVMVIATTMFGQRKLVSKDSLIPRRSAYGVVIDAGRLLLVNTRSTGKWSFPGGGCEGEETDAETAIREVQEETGISVTVGDLLVEVENYWHDDTTGTTYHQVGVFFRCRPLTYTLVADCNPAADDEAERPTWVPLARLTPEDFQEFGARFSGFCVALTIDRCSEVRRLLVRLQERITSDPNICHGKPCIRGLRYPVESLRSLLMAGVTVKEILEDYPDLEFDDIRAVLAYGVA